MLSTTRQLGEPGVRHLEVDQELRDDADDLAAGRQGRVGQEAHEPDAPAAVDEAHAGTGDEGPRAGWPRSDGSSATRGR
jgi:hypothetical protein